MLDGLELGPDREGQDSAVEHMAVSVPILLGCPRLRVVGIMEVPRFVRASAEVMNLRMGMNGLDRGGSLKMRCGRARNLKTGNINLAKNRITLADVLGTPATSLREFARV